MPPAHRPVGRQNLARAPISNLGCVLELLWLLLTTLMASIRPRQELMLECRRQGLDDGGRGRRQLGHRVRPKRRKGPHATVTKIGIIVTPVYYRLLH